jgi:bacterial/archaeal transporter family protein
MPYAWLIFALLSAIFAALVAIFGKIGLASIDTNTATAVRAVIMSIFLFAVIFMEGKINQLQTVFSNHKAMLFIVLSGIAGALSWLFYFLALKRGTIYQVVSIDRLSIVFAVLLAIVVLGEKISFIKAAGVGIMLIGAIIIAFAK